jgi:hypothetical protein
MSSLYFGLDVRGRIQSEEMITIKWSWSIDLDFWLKIFRIHEQFAAGEFNQSGGRYVHVHYLYKMAQA